MKRSNWMVMALAAVAVLSVAPAAFAQAGEHAAAAGAGGLGAVAAGLGLGIAVLGGALGQGRTATAALNGIARNPQAAGKLFTPMILGLALIESLVLIAFAIAWQLQGK